MNSDLTEWQHGLTNPNCDVRREAARQLAMCGPEARDSAVALARASGDDDEEVREWAAGALEELGPPNPQDIPDLVGLLSEPAADTVYWAVTLLGRLQQQAADAAPELIDALPHKNEPAVRQRIVWALGQLGNPVAATTLQKLASQAKDVRLARLANAALQNLQH